MQESKLIVLLKSLSSEEFRWFYKFVKSPYCNVNKSIVKLYELLRKYYPDFEHPKLSYEAIFKGLFPGEDFDMPRLRLLFHRMAKLVEAFLVNEEIKSDDLLNKNLLTRALGRMNTYDLFQKRTDELLNILEASPYRDVDYFKNKEQVNLRFYSHPATDRQNKGTEHLNQAMESLDTYFVLSKIKLACAIGARTQTLSEKSEIRYLDLALEKTEWSNLLISIYSKILELQNESEEDIDTFDKVRALYVTNLDQIGQKDKRDILHLLLNFCSQVINIGNAAFYQYGLELYKIGLEHDCLLDNKELSESTFINIVASAIGCKEFEWAKSFIENYGNCLDKAIKSDAINYSWAIWYFHQNDFTETIKLIANYSFSRPIQIVIVKALLIRTYVELFLTDDTYYDLSITQIDTFRRYIRNNHLIAESAADGYLNFTQLTKQFVKLKFQNKDLKNFENKLLATQNLRLKNWLLEKVKR